jgi:hypothetical protein
MNQHDRIFAEATLRALVIEHHERELDEFENDTSEIHFSEKHEQRMKRTFFIQHTKRVAVRVWVVTYKAAMAFAIMLAVLSSALLFNGRVMAVVKEVVVEWYEDFTTVRFAEKDKSSESIVWRLGYLPEGFAIKIDNSDATSSEVWYESVNGVTLYFSAYPAGDTTTGIDNEHSEYKVVVEDAIEYHIFTSSDSGYPSSVIWKNDGYEFLLNSELDTEILLKIAISVETKG